MADFCYTVLCNGALASVWAVCVYVATLTIKPLRRPAVRHLLWVLVLLRLTVPTLLPVDLSPIRQWAASTLHQQQENQTVVMRQVMRDSTEVLSAALAASQESSLIPLPDVLPSSGELAVAQANSGLAILQNSLRSFERFSIRLCGRAFYLLFPIIVTAAMACIAFHVRSAWLFRCNVKRHAYASRIWQRRTERVASRMGLRTCPQMLLVRATISPMLWGFGIRSRILFPEKLLENLTIRAQDTLIAHELAHYRRGDQWVRLLELFAMAFFWWHPVFWWARAEIERAEEQCCDAWAVRQSLGSPRTYAEALLATVDFVSLPILPPIASGANRGAFLRERLQAIMCHPLARGRSLLPDSYPSVVVLAAFVLLPSPVFLTSLVTAPKPAIVAVVGNGNVANQPERKTTLSGSQGDRLRPVTTSNLPASKVSNVNSPRLIVDDRYQVTFQSGRGVAIDLGIGRVSASVFSDDGSRLAIGTCGGQVQLFNSQTGVLMREWSQGFSKVDSVGFSPDARLLAVAVGDLFRIVETSGKGQSTVQRMPGFKASSVRFAKNGKSAAVVWRRRARRIVRFYSQNGEPSGKSLSTTLGVETAFDNVSSKTSPPLWRFVTKDGVILGAEGSSLQPILDRTMDPEQVREFRLRTTLFDPALRFN